MGFLVTSIVGAILGWLAANVVKAHARVASLVCTLAGTFGALAGAWASGEVPLSQGVSAPQLLWGVLASLLAIICVNVIGLRQSAAAGKI